MSLRTRARRASVLVAGGVLVASGLGLAVPAPVAHAADTPAPEAAAAANWLAGVIGDDGLIPGGGVNGFFYAANLDFGVGLVQTGQAPSAALTKIVDGVDATVASYVGDPAAPANAGKLAQAAYFYAVTGGDPKAAGDSVLDLETALEAQVDDTTGQLGNIDYAGNQVWAVLALTQLGSDEAEKARDFLVGQRETGDAAGWGFGDGTSNPDITSWAVQALATWSWNTRVHTAMEAGVAYLKSVQVGGGIEDPYLGVNANSTGAAAHAFAEAGHPAEAAAAATWIAEHQVVALPRCGVTPTHAGAIAYDDATLAGGIGDDDLDQTAPATAQALVGLAYLPRSAPTVSATTSYVAAGANVAVKVAGLRATQPACVSGGATPVKKTGPGAVTIKAPAGTATRTLTLTTLGVTRTTTLKVLAATKLAVKAPLSARRGTTVAITVSRLAPGEKVTVTVGGVRVVGKATSAGTYVARLTAPRRAGTAKVVVVGQFVNRTGTTTFRVR
ncbi:MULTISPECIES: hypothetical protein [unclassified Nocardioides]|uniref:hypothetical protein n=1 Tax=unclassified Nocardioides TaxID=2615069 RepID=UPI0012FA727C|nr:MULTISPECIES: hypothetical protein [unclassified Nocardioides]